MPIRPTPNGPDETLCVECGKPLVEAEDIEEGMHFLCDPTLDMSEDEAADLLDERDEFDEGGESG